MIGGNNFSASHVHFRYFAVWQFGYCGVVIFGIFLKTQKDQGGLIMKKTVFFVSMLVALFTVSLAFAGAPLPTLQGNDAVFTQAAITDAFGSVSGVPGVAFDGNKWSGNTAMVQEGGNFVAKNMKGKRFNLVLGGKWFPIHEVYSGKLPPKGQAKGCIDNTDAAGACFLFN